MRDDEPRPLTVLAMVGYALLLWVVIKASVIGYYPDQAITHMVIPGVVGAALIGLDRLRSRQDN